jgi:hypothetical protein
MVLFAFNARGDNGTHMHISKPKISFAKEYNYFKTSRYYMYPKPTQVGKSWPK